MFYSFAKAIVKPIMYILFRVKYIGRENLPSEGGYIACANHRSLWDPIFIGIGEKKRKFSFMAKKELFKFKPFGAIIKSLGAFPVNRKSADIGAIKNAVDTVKGGKALLIFPEGTRSKYGKPLRPKSGAVYIANEANVNILPVSISFNTKKLRLGTKVTISFGKMISTDEIRISQENKTQDARKASEYVMNKIIEMQNNIKNKAENEE